MSSFIGTTEFIRNLDDWLLRADQKNADFLHRNRDKIPQLFRNYTKTLYRGMSVDVEFLNQIEKTGYKEFSKHTSWSKDLNMAKKFVDDPAFKLSQKKDSIKILIKKNISTTQQIIDIDSFVLFMGVDQLEILGFDETNLDSASKEKEVLVSSKIRIQKKDITFL